MAAVERCDEVALPEVAAARHVDDIGAAGQFREELRVQDVPRLGSERQDADEKIALAEKRIEFAAAREAPDTVDLFFRAAPTRDGEAEIAQAPRGDGTDLAHAQNADPRILRWSRQHRLTPFRFALRGLERPFVTVLDQDMHDDVLRHFAR